MILYHYTAIELLAAIEREGLSKGDVPITEQEGRDAVWFTTDPNPAGHGLSDGGPLSPQEQAAVEQRAGRKLDPLHHLDKRRVRIAVVIPSHDRKLKEWSRYAKTHIAPDWLGLLNKAGGGEAKARTWHLYFGTIPPGQFRSIEVRGPDGQFHAITDDDRAEAQRKTITDIRKAAADAPVEIATLP